jgi:hypothetical protein
MRVAPRTDGLALREAVLIRHERSVEAAGAQGVLPAVRFFSTIVPDDERLCEGFLAGFRLTSAAADVVFCPQSGRRCISRHTR